MFFMLVIKLKYNNTCVSAARFPPCDNYIHFASINNLLLNNFVQKKFEIMGESTLREYKIIVNPLEGYAKSNAYHFYEFNRRII